MMRKTVHTLLASIGLCLSSVAGAVDSWDAVGDFNHMSGNPNPPWSYESNAGLLSMPVAACFGTTGLFCWGGGGPFDTPFVGINTSGSSFTTGGGHVIAESVLFLHPSNDAVSPNSTVKVRWTVPTNGRYRFVGYFQLADKNAPDNGVVANIRCTFCVNHTMWTTTFSGYSKARWFNTIRFLAAGNSITFEVENNGSFNNDLTALKAAIFKL
jgi:hypothetical protein